MSVLQDMTRGIMQTKATKASKLTPVAGESSTTVAQVAAGIPEVGNVFLTNEAVADIAKDLRKQAAILLDVAGGLDALTSLPSKPAVSEVVVKAREQALAEKAADEAAQQRDADETDKFAASLAAKTEAAKAAVFANLDDGEDEEPFASEAPADGWVCPDHGASTIQELTSRKGRVYRACTQCDEFEK